MHPAPGPVSASVLHAIGNTPVVRLRKVVPEDSAEVLVKLEYFNPTGSYKDRMALAMIEGAEQRGTCAPGMRVVEYTGGSTGSSLAFVCAVKGYPFTAVSSDAFAQREARTMRALRRELVIVPSEGGRITPDLFPPHGAKARKSASRARRLLDRPVQQRRLARSATAPSARSCCSRSDGPIDAFCGAVGTAGMLMGVARALREAGQPGPGRRPGAGGLGVPHRGAGGSHRVEGIGARLRPAAARPGELRRGPRRSTKTKRARSPGGWRARRASSPAPRPA